MKFGKPMILITLLVLILILSSNITVHAGEEKEGGILSKRFLKILGDIALYVGLSLNGFYLFSRAAVRSRASLMPARAILNFHIISNLLLESAVLIHAVGFIDKAGSIEYASVIIILLLTLSGFIMRVIGEKRAKLLSRLIHGQMILSIILIVFILLHVAYIKD